MPFFHLTYFFFLLFIGLAAFTKTAAQEYIFNHLSTRDGLLSNNILALHQDKKGFLWIGTENGLQRYDGYHFMTIAATAVKTGVNQIVEDSSGYIWLRMGKTVGVLDPIRFSFKEVRIQETHPAYDPVLYELKRDADKNIFVLIRGVGCYYLNKDKTIFTSHNTPFQIPEGWSNFNTIDDAIQKRYWIYGTKGLGYFDKVSKQFYSHQHPSHHPLLADPRLSSDIVNFYIDQRRRYWIERWNSKIPEYYCYDEKKGSFTNDTAGLSASANGSYYEIHHFTEFNDTTVLVYGLNCMAMRENGYFTGFRSPVYSPYSIQFNVVHAVLEDREHILWVATDDGLYNTMATINNNRHLMLGQDKGRSVINCLLEDEAKNIWIGTWGKGLIVLDSNLVKHPLMNAYLKNHKEDANVDLNWALHQHTVTKKIWVGCQRGRLLIYDPKTNGVQIINPPVFENQTVRQLAEDRNGDLWFGLQNGKLFSYHLSGNDGKFREVHRFHGFISRLKPDGKGRLWIAVAADGTYVMDMATDTILKTYNTTNGSTFPGNDVRDILPLNDSIYLIAGDQLTVLNIRNGQAKHISRYDNTFLGKILSLQPGNKDECWLSTGNGMYRYHVSTGSLIKYNQWDGLITVFNNSYIMETSLLLRNKKLVFAGNQNFVLFDPARYKEAAIPSDVQLTAFQLSAMQLPVDSIMALPSLHLNYNENAFTIDFASLSFTQLEKLTYEYQLEGADKDWIRIHLPQGVKYALLPPGTYSFMVRVKNSEGVYSNNSTRLQIIIQPPFWKTYWFLAIIVAAVAGFLYYLHRLRLKRLLGVEKVRSKLARDLHDDMGSTLSTINILSNMALQQLNLDERTNKNFMSKISESTSQMMESMDDIIWSINPLNDSMGKVLARMKQVAGTVLEPQGIEYCFEAEEVVKDVSFTMEWRREIFLIYKEAINNIVKYAQCTVVQVTLRKERSSFVIIIKDNGVGFDTNHKKEALPTRGNGLINMQKRAATMQGHLQIIAAKNAGTKILLTIPLA